MMSWWCCFFSFCLRKVYLLINDFLLDIAKHWRISVHFLKRKLLFFYSFLGLHLIINYEIQIWCNNWWFMLHQLIICTLDFRFFSLCWGIAACFKVLIPCLTESGEMWLWGKGCIIRSFFSDVLVVDEDTSIVASRHGWCADLAWSSPPSSSEEANVDYNFGFNGQPVSSLCLYLSTTKQ